MDERKFALEIKNLDVYRVACAIWPHLSELTFEQVRLNFLVFDAEGDGLFALYAPGAIVEHISMIEPGPNVQFKKVLVK